MSVDAVVLAGRKNDGKLAEMSHERLEANIDVAGKPMVSYVLAALSQVPKIGRVYLVGPRDGLSRYENDGVTVVPPGESLFENTKIGLSHVKSEFAVICASDIPLITASILGDLLDRCLASGADFCYPASFKADCEAAFPGVQRTYITLTDGVVTGGNIFFVRASAVEKAWPMVEKMITYRKEPLKMAGVLGFRLLIKMAFKRGGAVDLERRVGGMLGITPKAILGVRPEIGVDVDKPSDLELCRRVLAE